MGMIILSFTFMMDIVFLGRIYTFLCPASELGCVHVSSHGEVYKPLDINLWLQFIHPFNQAVSHHNPELPFRTPHLQY
jgi:hypothetical protein